MARAIEVHITAPNQSEAAAMAKVLVEEGLAACVNIVSGVRSIFSWEGKIHDESEVLCLLKTRPELFGALADRVRELHSYDVPEVIAFEVDDGSPAYLDWLATSTRAG